MKKQTFAIIAAMSGFVIPAISAEMPMTDKDFCTRVQRDLTGTTLALNNIVYPSYDAFKESKTKVDPVEIGQYVTTLADGRTPMRVSCKTKTSDHLQDRYGKDAATGDKTCADINRTTIDGVYAALSDDERAKLKIAQADVVIEPDEVVYMGSQWVTDYDFVYRDPEAKIHLMGKSLYVTWTNVAFAWAPERFRGVRYCHLIAPEYARKLVIGEAELLPPVKK
ncbi:MAG: hypothetical protein EXR11_02500 [Rhodospirillaceae bacterium]|nr:hypothetical protein [Rhodospirillaceae bacterium]